jgi:WD40 repeat protein
MGILRIGKAFCFSAQILSFEKIAMLKTVIVFGTYEGGVVGFEVSIDGDDSVDFLQILSTPCHMGCVRSVASMGRYAVTAGTDELINVFDVSKRLQLGNMGGSVHTSTITALALNDNPGILVSGCEDGQIAITRVKDFQTLKSFKGHKSAVLDLSVHPTGKIALSISSDNTLRMWDLTRGTCAAVRTVCPLKRPNTGRGIVSTAHMIVKYTPLGSRYVLLLPGGKVEICSSSSMDVAEYIGSITSIVPLTEEVYLAGDNSGSLQVLRIEGGKITLISELSKVHNSRMRGMARIGSIGDYLFAASVCAEGKVIFSRFDVKANKLEEIRSVETGMRITCFASNSS